MKLLKYPFVVSVLRIRIRRIRMFLGLRNPDPNPWVPYGSGSFCHHAQIVRQTFFVDILKVSDEKSVVRVRIRIRIQIHYSEAWIRVLGSGSTPKCHGSGTLLCIQVVPVPLVGPGGNDDWRHKARGFWGQARGTPLIRVPLRGEDGKQMEE